MVLLNQQSSNRVLLVEGHNDEHVVVHLRKRDPSFSNIDFDIEDKRGLPNLLESIVSEIQTPDRQAVGILVDADDCVRKRWNEVTKELSEVGIQAPSNSKKKGTIINTNGKPRVGIWLMPDNKSPGKLENFVKRTIPQNDPVWPLSQDYINKIPETDREFKPPKIVKAKVHAWLATRKDPGLMGRAVRDLDIKNALCQEFLDWLKVLFK